MAEAVRKFREENKSLQQILNLATASHVQQLAQPESALENLVKDDDASRLGLTMHAEIRRVLAQPESRNEDLCLDAKVESHPDARVGNTSPECLLRYCSLSSPGSARKRTVLVEYKSYPPGTDSSNLLVDHSRQSRVHLRINQLANLLKSSGKNSVGTLECLGFVNQPAAKQYTFIFDFPKDSDFCWPISLNSVIQEHPIWSLTARFDIASSIAKEIGGFHADGWVHKSLRSHSVIFFDKADSHINTIRKRPYLAGFEYSRPEDGSTTGIRDDDRDRNLYRHPALQAVAGDSFTKAHDLYSLGVVLLEIAVWGTASKIYERAPARPENPSGHATRIDPKFMHQQYVKVAKAKIPYLMGEPYLNAVLACLESKYSNQIYRPNFSKIFYDEVIQQLSPRGLLT